jgi:hypothetical protein
MQWRFHHCLDQLLKGGEGGNFYLLEKERGVPSFEWSWRTYTEMTFFYLYVHLLKKYTRSHMIKIVHTKR